MSYSEFTHQSIIQQRHAELRRELEEIRAARGLPAYEVRRPVREALARLQRLLAGAAGRAFGRPAGQAAPLGR